MNTGCPVLSTSPAPYPSHGSTTTSQGQHLCSGVWSPHKPQYCVLLAQLETPQRRCVLEKLVKNIYFVFKRVSEVCRHLLFIYSLSPSCNFLPFFCLTVAKKPITNLGLQLFVSQCLVLQQSTSWRYQWGCLHRIPLINC